MKQKLASVGLWIALLLWFGCLHGCSDKVTDATSTNLAIRSGSATVPLVDPSATYAPRSDPSITQQPAGDLLIGDGSRVSIGYDGSKGTGLSYSLFYIQDNGTVVPMTGGFFTDEGSGSFAATIFVYNSDADGRSGFMELETVLMPPGTTAENAMQKAKTVSLGMYAVRFQVAK
jgi:hypothetical protein